MIESTIPLDSQAQISHPISHAGLGRSERPLALREPWFCVQAIPQEEGRAFQEISQAGFRAHLPQYLFRRKRFNKSQILIKPLFPSYLFVAFDPEDPRWAILNHVRGVRKIFTTPSGLPWPLPEGEVERLMALGRAGDGVIDDEAPAFPRIVPGQSVRITAGPFADWSGVCQWADDVRIGVLMKMFAADRVVPMWRSSVEVM